jgi:hypothetical protein
MKNTKAPSIRWRRSPVSLGVVLAAFMLDCATLTPLAEGTCGNGVVDANEDCDSFPDACGRPDNGAKSCRLTCDRAQAGSCPVGWGCSVEGICRQATGNFDRAGAPTSAGVETLLAGDFDGDGRMDLFGGGSRNGSSKPRIHFFDSSGVAAPPIAIQFPMSTPVVRDIDGDGRDDLAYAFNADNRFGAVGVLGGTADRTFRSILYPTYTRPSTALRFATIPFDPLGGYFTPNGQAALITVERTSAGTFFRSISGVNVVSLPELEQPAPFGPEQVVGQPIVARVFDPEATPLLPSICGDVVFAYNDGDVGHLSILSPCAGTNVGGELAPRWQSRPPKDIVLPSKVTGNTLAVVLSASGYPEIFVTTAGGTYVASSDGTAIGPFAKFEETSEPGKKVELPMPLAIVDIDGDTKLDVVLPTGLFITGTPGIAPTEPEPDGGVGAAFGDTTAVRPTTGRWDDARVGDFNGDGRLDLVALSPAALEVEFFANAGNSRFTRFSVPSPEPVRAIATGDFDGDTILDVAFLASSRTLGDETTTGETDLLIAYGKPSGGPETARVVGRFKEARGIATLHQVNRSIDEIVVFEATPAKDALPASALTYVFSSGDRQAIAPLLFRDDLATVQARPDQIRLWLGASLVAAPLVKPGVVDVMSIAAGITYRAIGKNEGNFVKPFPTGAWFAGGGASAGLDPLREVFRFEPTTLRALNDDAFDQGVVESLVVAASADIDSPPDGISEIVTLTRGQAPDTTDLLIVRKSDLDAKVPSRRVTLPDFAVRGGNDELALLDVNGDERPDAVLITRGTARGKLRVYLNDGAGGFGSTALVVDLPPPSPGEAPEVPAGFARVVTGTTPDGKPRAELAVVTSSRLFLAAVKADKSGFEVRDLTELLGTASVGITSIAAGDLDGDGVQDIAIADSGTIRVLRQLPRLQ